MYVPESERTKRKVSVPCGSHNSVPTGFNRRFTPEMPSVWEAGGRFAVLVAIRLRMEAAWVIP
jgi:hypothetical protein